MSLCSTCWGSHGCDLVEGHVSSIHGCYAEGEPCSQYDPVIQQARYWDDETGEWSEWMNCKEIR